MDSYRQEDSYKTPVSIVAVGPLPTADDEEQRQQNGIRLFVYLFLNVGVAQCHLSCGRL